LYKSNFILKLKEKNMAVKIRLARGGAKKRPYYSVVVANADAPRDGKFIEKIGTYNPLVAKDHADRFKIDQERLQYWIASGAQPTERVAKLANLAPAKNDGAKVAKPAKKAKA
jgi:small subunit ribosomal protein S16